MPIFNKTDDEDQPEIAMEPRTNRTPSANNNKSVIGPSLVFKGEFSANEDLIIEGQIEGSIAHHKKHLTIGKQGRVKADIHAASVIVLGNLVGDIHSDGTVSLAKGCDVEGNIYCDRVVLEDGARFKGEIDMGDRAKIAAVPNNQKIPEAVRTHAPQKMAISKANVKT
jgi:cytoskeletal protein CcmA (bactofilin family)